MTGCPLLDSEFAARQNGKKLPCERLAAENAKLRELVRHALTFCVNGYCSEYEGCMWTIGKSCSFADRAKKLGVVG